MQTKQNFLYINKNLKKTDEKKCCFKWVTLLDQTQAIM